MEMAFTGADILLPGPKVNMEKWAVVACDQFTSEPEYWEETKEIVGSAPSALKLILPEVYLETENVEQRLKVIQNTMDEYMEQGIFQEYKDAMIYVERRDSRGRKRKGIVGKIDLEYYDYRKNSQSQVRATEATVAVRIPPRRKVRKEAWLELPHIMLLIDDLEETVIESLEGKKERMKKLYDFTLMQDGGAIEGYLLGKEEKEQVERALALLQQKALCKEQKENPEEEMTAKDCFLYAMGDGNHSLAAAKSCYEQWKEEHPGEDTAKYLGRYALVELVNLHSPALKFKAIHRLITEVDVASLMEKMTEELGLIDFSEWENQGKRTWNGDKSSIKYQETDRKSDRAIKEAQIIRLWYQGNEEKRVITKPGAKLSVGSVQKFLDEYLKDHPGKIDYIHGEQAMKQLTQKENTLGILLEDMKKEELFPTVMADGALPRKTFSMGHARDKRYYLEGRKIK